jgi:hypothetical protein
VHELGVIIGDVAARLESSDTRILAVARSRYAGFLGPRAPRWNVRLEVGGVSRPGADLQTTVDCGRVRLSRSDFVAHLEPDRHSGCATLVEPDRIALEAFLRVMWSIALPDAGGMLVHAASVERNGRAFLFPGRSGSGKTTLCRLSRANQILSDEMSLVCSMADGATCHGTPFAGELGIPGPNRAVPLSAVCMLEHGERHALVRERPPGALRALLPHVVHFVRDAGLTARVFAVAARLVEQVPCFRLSFRRDPGFWDLLDAV